MGETHEAEEFKISSCKPGQQCWDIDNNVPAMANLCPGCADAGQLFEMGLLSQNDAILLSTTDVPNPEREEMIAYLRRERDAGRLIRVARPPQEVIDNARNLGFLIVPKTA